MPIFGTKELKISGSRAIACNCTEQAEPAAQKQYVDGAVISEQIRGKLQSAELSEVTKITSMPTAKFHSKA